LAKNVEALADPMRPLLTKRSPHQVQKASEECFDVLMTQAVRVAGIWSRCLPADTRVSVETRDCITLSNAALAFFPHRPRPSMKILCGPTKQPTLFGGCSQFRWQAGGRWILLKRQINLTERQADERGACQMEPLGRMVQRSFLGPVQRGDKNDSIDQACYAKRVFDHQNRRGINNNHVILGLQRVREPFELVGVENPVRVRAILRDREHIEPRHLRRGFYNIMNAAVPLEIFV
jgi:hypothetical protein